MPAQEKTHFLGLNAWQGNEYVKRADFVDDNITIDNFARLIAFSDLTMLALLRNLRYFYEKAGDVYTEIVGASKENVFAKRVSTKNGNGWTINVQVNDLNKTFRLNKIGNNWESEVV